MKKIYLLFIFLTFQQLWAQQTVGLFQNDSLSLNGYTLLSNIGASEVYLVNNCGDVVNNWTASTFTPGPVVYLLNDGSLLKTCRLANGRFLAGGSGGRLERYNWNDSLIWEYNIDSPTEKQHHDVTVLPNGNILVLSWDLYTKSQAIAAGLDTNLYSGEVWSEKIIELSPVGSDSATIVWEWKLWDHLIQDFNNLASNFGSISSNSQLVDLNYSNNNGISADYFHANALDYNPQLDQILISVRNFDEFWVIDHSTTTQQAASDTGGLAGMGGDILYRWGNPETYGRGTLADKKLFGQHNPNWIPTGFRDEGKIIVFNNGFNDSNQVSKVQIINPPVQPNGSYVQLPNMAFGPLSVDWSYDMPVFVDFVSGAVRLENGNTFITSGPDGHLYELDDKDSLVWEYVSPLEANNIKTTQGVTPTNNTLFRAYRYSENYSAFTNKVFQLRGALERSPLPSNCILYPAPIVTGLIAENEPEVQLKVYPNPIVDQLTIHNLSSHNLSIQIRNMKGQLVWRENLSETFYHIDCSNWSKGMYVITFEDEGNISTQKLIKL